MFNSGEIKKKQLIEEINRLEEENKKLLKDIDEIEKKDEITRATHLIGEEKKLLYWGMPVRYLDSVFYTRKKEIIKDNDISMADDMSKFLPLFFIPCARDKLIFRMAAMCDEVIKEGEGFRLIVSDPYRKVVSDVLDMDDATAYSLPGKLLYLNCMFTSKDNIFIKRWKKTDLTLNGYKGSSDPVTNTITKPVLDIKNITTENEAVSAVTALQNYYLLKERDVKVARFSPTELRVLQHTGGNSAILYSVSFINNEFWYFEEPGHNFIYKELSDNAKKLYQEMGIYEPTELCSRRRWAFSYRKEKEPEQDYD